MSLVDEKWETVDSKLLIENPFITLRDDTVKLPDGVVKHFYTVDRGKFAVVIPLSGNTLTLVRQFRYGIKQVSWEFPMGVVKGTTDTRKMAEIELQEEVGMTAGSLTEIGSFWQQPGTSNEEGFVYLVEELRQGEPSPEEGELLEAREFSIDEVKQMIETGEIKDACTITAFHLFENYLNHG